jgi:hypothetical protein
MIEPTLQQEAEGIRPRAIWWVGGSVIAVGAVLVVIAWWLVAPPASIEPAARASTLEHGLIERATGGADLHAAGAQALERTQWVDRQTGVVRIPIERAIDAVVADPKLISAHPAAVSPTGAVLGAMPQSSPPAANVPAPSLTWSPPSSHPQDISQSPVTNPRSAGQPSPVANPRSTRAPTISPPSATTHPTREDVAP